MRVQRLVSCGRAVCAGKDTGRGRLDLLRAELSTFSGHSACSRTRLRNLHSLTPSLRRPRPYSST